MAGSALVAAAAAWLSLLNIDTLSLWNDELSTVHKAFLIDSGAMFDYLRHDAHPPLYYLALRLWGSIVPHTGPGIRLFSWLCYLGAGVLIATQAYGLARILDLQRPWIAGCSALLMAMLSPFPVYFSGEAKGYSMMILLLAGDLYLRQLFLVADCSFAKPRLLIASCLIGLLLASAALTHYYACFFLLGLFVVDGVVFLRRRQPKRGVIRC